jgi:hypothetical protein
MTYPINTDLKTYLAITGSTEDSLLTTIINGAINYVERATGRDFVSASATRSFPCLPQFVDSGRKMLTTKGMDFASVSAIVNGDGDTLSASEYYLWPIGALTDGRPYYRVVLTDESGLVWTDRPSLIAVTAHWGFSTACPAAIFEALLELGANMYRRRQTGNTGQVLQVGRAVLVQPGDLSSTITDVIQAYKRGSL